MKQSFLTLCLLVSSIAFSQTSNVYQSILQCQIQVPFEDTAVNRLVEFEVYFPFSLQPSPEGISRMTYWFAELPEAKLMSDLQYQVSNTGTIQLAGQVSNIQYLVDFTMEVSNVFSPPVGPSKFTYDGKEVLGNCTSPY